MKAVKDNWLPLSRFLKGLLCGLLMFSFLSCSNKYIDDIDRGSGYNYQPGYPELRMAVSGQINFETPTIIVSGDIVYGSLIYTKKGDEFTANVRVEISIQRQGEVPEVIRRISFEEEITRLDQRIVNSQNVFRFERSFEVPPGSYIVSASVMDQASSKQTTRSQATSIPNPEDEISHITEIRVLAKENGSVEDSSETNFIQSTTYDIQASFDSLKFVFQVTNNNPDRPLKLNSRLLKFESDSTIARPMYFNDYSPSSIQYRGIDYDEYEVIQQSTRTLSQPGSVLIEFIFTDLSNGNYRLEVTSNEDQESELYKARDFSIKSPHYPSLKSPKELARPLHYLMDEKEHEKLMAIEDPAKLKAAIDRFWLGNIQNSRIAKNVISLFYQRVEEANKQFSNFKEGWKTDLGMIFILFGPPWYNENFSDQMVWSYSYNQSDPEKNFLFVQTKLNTKYYPFYNYLLQRNPGYYNIQHQQRERWKNGTILKYNL